MTEHAAIAIELAHLPHGWLRDRRWFSAKGRTIAAIDTVDWGPLPGADTAILALARVRYTDGGADIYALPLLASGEERLAGAIAPAAFELPGDGRAYIHDALGAPAVRDALLGLMLDSAELPMQDGRVLFRPEPAFLEIPPSQGNSRLLSVEQSNSALVFDDRAFLKLFRRVVTGLNPDVEVGRFLTRAGFPHVPPVLGDAVYLAGTQEHSLALLQAWAANQGAAWDTMLERLAAFFAAVPRGHCSEEEIERTTARLAHEHFEQLEQLGRLTGELHRALASDSDDPDFAPRPVTRTMTTGWKASIRELRDAMLPQLAARAPELPRDQREIVERVLGARGRIEDAVTALDGLDGAGVTATRFHGDYHLGQILVTESGYLVIDFEGEPMRSLEERRAHGSPLKDVAGMLRSLSYAASAGLFTAGDAVPGVSLTRFAGEWEQQARRAFLHRYWDAVQGASFVPADQQVRDAALRAFELEKALYELGYELNNRPDWLPIPLRGIAGAIGR